jgi:hypothetical protein
VDNLWRNLNVLLPHPGATLASYWRHIKFDAVVAPSPFANSAAHSEAHTLPPKDDVNQGLGAHGSV